MAEEITKMQIWMTPDLTERAKLQAAYERQQAAGGAAASPVAGASGAAATSPWAGLKNKRSLEENQMNSANAAENYRNR